MNRVNVIRTGLFSVNTLVVLLDDKKCFVVDPAACKLSGDENKIVDYLQKKKLECVGIVLTHSHFDHITGIATVKNAFPKAKILIHKSEENELQNPPGPMGRAVIRFFGLTELLDEVSRQPAADLCVQNGDTLACFGKGGEAWKVIDTPGHTPGSICLYNEVEKLLISGDTIFAYGGVGRTDMVGGDEETLVKSLIYLKKNIPSGTLVYPGHDEFGFSL